jgi:predicted MPP superfamily phosphohydrolase
MWIDANSNVARILTLLAALAGACAFVHFLFPYRRGITRESDRANRSTSELVPGIVLADVTASISGLPAEADGITCLVLSDLHCNDKQQLELVRRAVKQLRSDCADLVFLLGDFGERRELLPEIVAMVANLPTRFGTYCVLGNHDFEGGRRPILLDLLQRCGVRVLDDEYYEVKGLGINLLGLAYPWSGTQVLPERRKGFVLALTHSPDNLPYLAGLGVPLAFAGHTHGGKFKLPGLGAMLVPSAIGRFLDEGWFRLGDTSLYLTRGLGYFPGRFGNRGEVCRFTLNRRINHVE